MLRVLFGALSAVLFLSIILSSAVSAGPIEPSPSVKAVLLKDLTETTLPSNAKWSFTSVDLGSGEKLIEAGNSTGIPLVPGSIIKLFITAAILDADRKDRIELDTMTRYGVIVSNPDFRDAKGNPNSESLSLTGKTFVITGKMYDGNAKVLREDLELEIIRLGGQVSGSVSKKTNYIIAGADPGSKLSKAQTLGVKVISYDNFKSLVSAAPETAEEVSSFAPGM